MTSGRERDLQHRGGSGLRFTDLFGDLHQVRTTEREADQVLHEQLALGELARRWASLCLEVLDAPQRAADPRVAPDDQRVDPQALRQAEERHYQRTVIEDLEEAGHRCRCAIRGSPLTGRIGGDEVLPVDPEAEVERPELEACGLLGDRDLVHGEVRRVIVEHLHRRREEDRQPVGGGRSACGPPDASLAEQRSRVEADRTTAERLGVAPEHPGCLRELDSTRERGEQLLGLRRLEPEPARCPLASVGVGEQIGTGRGPAPTLLGTDLRPHLRSGGQERARRRGVGSGHLHSQRDQLVLLVGRSDRQRLGSAGEPLEASAADLLHDQHGQLDESDAHGRLHPSDEPGEAPQAVVGLHAGSVHDLAQQPQEGSTTRRLEGAEDRRRLGEARRGDVGLVDSHRGDCLHQPVELAHGYLAEQLPGEREVLRRQPG